MTDATVTQGGGLNYKGELAIRMITEMVDFERVCEGSVNKCYTIISKTMLTT